MTGRDVWLIRVEWRDGLVGQVREVFGIDESTAEKLIAAAPVPVKRGASQEVAEVIRDALEALGAEVEITDAGRPPSSGATSGQAWSLPPLKGKELPASLQDLAASTRSSPRPSARASRRPESKSPKKTKSSKPPRVRSSGGVSASSQLPILIACGVALLCALGFLGYWLTQDAEAPTRVPLSAAEADALATQLLARADATPASEYLAGSGRIAGLDAATVADAVRRIEEAGAVRVVAVEALSRGRHEYRQSIVVELPTGARADVAQGILQELVASGPPDAVWLERGRRYWVLRTDRRGPIDRH